MVAPQVLGTSVTIEDQRGGDGTDRFENYRVGKWARLGSPL